MKTSRDVTSAGNGLFKKVISINGNPPNVTSTIGEVSCNFIRVDVSEMSPCVDMTAALFFKAVLIN